MSTKIYEAPTHRGIVLQLAAERGLSEYKMRKLIKEDAYEPEGRYGLIDLADGTLVDYRLTPRPLRPTPDPAMVKFLASTFPVTI